MWPKMGYLMCGYVFITLTFLQFSVAQKNVLLIIIDDLRPEIGVFASTDDALNPGMDTPNIDTLANESIRFNRAFSQYSTCGPSRASFLTGRRPETTQVFGNSIDFRQNLPNANTIPQHFKNNNYSTFGFGKVFHTGHDDNDYSWTEPNFQPSNIAFWHKGQFDDLSWGSAVENTKKILPDKEILTAAIDKLSKLSTEAQDEHFFIAVGFQRPHLPLICPQNYFDKYKLGDVNLAENKNVPDDFPEIGWASWLDLYGYSDITGLDNSYNHSLADDKARELRRAYYACVSWVDYLVGELLKNVEHLGLYNDTVVALMSDHGYHLGEHSSWTKGTNFLLDSHVPFILRVPGVTDLFKSDNGIENNEFIEAVDLFPTLVDAAGLDPISQCPDSSSADVKVCHEGLSAYRFLQGKVTSKSFVLSQYQRVYGGRKYMGYSIFDGIYHYIRWVLYRKNLTYIQRLEQAPFAEELYSHIDQSILIELLDFDLRDQLYDPNETVNVANNPNYKTVKDEMFEKLKQGYKAALPE